MAVLYGLEFQHQSSASGKPHILSFLSARSVADDGVFEVWNAATSAGRIFRMTWEGQLQVEDGTAAKPSYGFKSDKDSGRYMSAAGTFLDVIGGTAVGTWTAGKLALAGDLEVGDDVTLKSDAAVLNFGADSDVSLTHVADTGLLLNSTMALQFNDASQYINAPSATVLDINATDEIELNATLVDVNANLEVSGTAAMTGVVTFTATPIFSSDLTIEDDLYLDSDAAVIHLGEDGDVTLTHVADTGILLNSTMQLQFNDASQYINAPSATVLDINATDEIELNATAVDLNGTLDVSGTSTLTGNVTMSADASVGDDLTLGSDAAVLNFGADSDVNLTHVADTGLLLNSTMALQFNDSSQYINAPSATVLDINATDEIELNATAVDLNGTLDVSGTSTLTGNVTMSADATVGDDLTLLSDAAVLGFGADTDVTLTHVADTGLLLNSTRQLQFNDASQYIAGTSATVLSIAATDEIDLTATAIDINGTANISGATVLATSLNIASDGATVTGIKDEDDMASNSATKLATQQSIVAYVAAQITAEDLDVSSDSGTIDIDLNSETLTIAGGTGLASSASSTTVTLAIDSTVATLTGSQTLTNKVLTSPDINAGTVDGITSLTVGTDGSGADVYFYSATSGDHLFWDASEELLTITGTNGQTALNVADGNVTVADDLDVDGTTNLDVVDIDGAVDMASTLTLAGNADFNGDLDVDGTTNLDAVDIDGAVQIDAAVTVGVDDTGYDVKFFGATASAYMLWDASADDLVLAGAAGIDLAGDLDVDGTTNLDVVDIDGAVDMASTLTLAGNADFNGDLDVDGTTNLDAVDIDGAVQIDAAVTVGVDDTGYDVKFFGATASAYMLWDASSDDLVLAGAAGIDLAGDLDVDGTTNLDVVDIDGAVDMASTLTVAGDVTLAATQKLYLDGGGDTYLYESAANTISFRTAGTDRWKIDDAGNLRSIADGSYDIGGDTSERPRGVYAHTFLTIGNNAAAAGEIRLKKDFGIFTRNNANDANKLLIGENVVTGNDTMDIGDNTKWSAIRFHVSTANVMELTSSAINLNKAVTANNAAIKLTGLATSDPGVAGQLWNSSGDLRISAG